MFAMIENRLKHILVDKRMSLRELADRTDITYSMVYDFANMRRQSVNFATLDAICRVLEVSPGDILHYRPEGE